MSATEVIEEIKKLPSEEQQKVLAFMLSKAGAKMDGNVDDRFKAIAAEIFQKNEALFQKLAQ